jgi:hypothetical protein
MKVMCMVADSVCQSRLIALSRPSPESFGRMLMNWLDYIESVL